MEHKQHGYDPASKLGNLEVKRQVTIWSIRRLEEKVKALQARVHQLEAQLVEMNSEPWRWRVQAILEEMWSEPSNFVAQKQQTKKHVGRFFGGQNLWEKCMHDGTYIHRRQMTDCRCMSWFWGYCPPFRWGISGKDCGIGGSMAQPFGKNTNVLKPDHPWASDID